LRKLPMLDEAGVALQTTRQDRASEKRLIVPAVTRSPILFCIPCVIGDGRLVEEAVQLPQKTSREGSRTDEVRQRATSPNWLCAVCPFQFQRIGAGLALHAIAITGMVVPEFRLVELFLDHAAPRRPTAEGHRSEAVGLIDAVQGWQALLPTQSRPAAGSSAVVSTASASPGIKRIAY
jgi:hypothetical protein